MESREQGQLSQPGISTLEPRVTGVHLASLSYELVHGVHLFIFSSLSLLPKEESLVQAFSPHTSFLPSLLHQVGPGFYSQHSIETILVMANDDLKVLISGRLCSPSTCLLGCYQKLQTILSSASFSVSLSMSLAALSQLLRFLLICLLLNFQPCPCPQVCSQYSSLFPLHTFPRETHPLPVISFQYRYSS